jgi:transposase
MLTEHTQPAKPDPEVLATPKRRRFSAEERRRLIREYEATPKGERGAFLRCNGLYSSYINAWKKQVTAGEISALAPKTRGRRAKPKPDPELEELRRENERLRVKLNQAEKVIEVQKKEYPRYWGSHWRNRTS